MNHIRVLTHDIQFGHLNYEHSLWLPSADSEQVVDVRLSLHGFPLVRDNSALTATGCNNVRLYIAGVDLTALLIDDLQAKLRVRRESGKLEEQLQQCLDAWLRVVDELGDAVYGSSAGEEREVVKRMLQTDPLEANLNALGDYATGGHAGNLHIFNFIYSEIPLQSVSLSELILAYNRSGVGDPIDRSKVRSIVLSAGPSRLVDAKNWDPKLAVGAVRLMTEMHLHNPLADVIKEIQGQLDELEEYIVEQLDDILERLGTAGAISKKLSQIDTLLDSARTEIESNKNEVESHGRQLNAVAKKVNELRSAVNEL